MARPGGQTVGFLKDSSVAVTNASTQVLAINNQRGYLLIFNPSATATIAFAMSGTTPVIGSVGVQLAPGQSFVFDGPRVCNAFNAIASANGNIGIWEG